ncbi:hypothetical protein [Planococcus glaciei]|nr:hypothetical protein [Planococcus glaciei]
MITTKKVFISKSLREIDAALWERQLRAGNLQIAQSTWNGL